MGIFGNSSPFDEDVEKATSENNTSEQWGLILEICDRGAASAAAARDCLRAVLRRLGHSDPHVQLQAATLLDACVSNCGRPFLLEVASRDFTAEFRRIIGKSQRDVAGRLRQLLRKWAEGDFKDDPQLDLIVSLHASMKDSTAAAAPTQQVSSTSTAAADAAKREQEELARAIALSLRETAAPAPAAAAPLYPSVAEPPPPPSRKVRALYDFEAAEDNELTFLAGEIVVVTDASDPNWWKGHNERGEGLFPANFVTADLSQPSRLAKHENRASGGKSVQFAADAVPAAAASGAAVGGEAAGGVVCGDTLDAALAALHDADPEAPPGHDDEALLRRERAIADMAGLIDAALERADTRHARLTTLSAELVDALNLYHELMRASHPAPPYYMHPPGGVAPYPRPN